MSHHHASPRAARAVLPKLCGGDFELGNFISGLTCEDGTGYEASRLLLREIDGVRASARDTAPAADPRADALSQDTGRKFLSNGGCAYIDLNHLEVCLPEVRSAHDHVAHTHALYRIAHRAAMAANERLRAPHKIVVLANNSDGQGNSFGSHLNVLVAREAWEMACHRKLLHQGFLAAFQASSIVCTGLGKVGAENGAPAVRYQISQRADFIETLCSSETTIRRPIINTRNEPLCGSGYRRTSVSAELARMHVITYDHNLCHGAGLLKIGALQLVLAMLECDWINQDLLLEDPVLAIREWSHDPMLNARARLWSGTECTVVELQLRFFEEAQRFVATGACADAVPHADAILQLWGDTLQKLERRDFESLRRRLDWVLKLSILSQAQRQRADLNWGSPQIKVLDHLYSSLDPAEGLYWSYEQRGLVDRHVNVEQIERAENEPPTDTRAWTRARLLQFADSEDVDQLDWDFLRFSLTDEARSVAVGFASAVPSTRLFTVEMSDPLRSTEADNASRLADARDLRSALIALDAEESFPRPAVGTWTALDGNYSWHTQPKHSANHHQGTHDHEYP